ncbi:hypothetical protein [Flavobacterium sp. UBA7663]|uniref:hypothetical protein n=1 Tax=Flavobacterium sp. UBA7663 TaxID=1946557 RepID=UPI0025BB3595|nr:hypothetical protein [Flavobacterium sp. UBA7663]
MENEIGLTNLYKSDYSKSFFDFGNAEIPNEIYEIKFGANYPINLYNTSQGTFIISKVKDFGYNSDEFFGNSYPFEYMKENYVKIDKLNTNLFNNFQYSGGIFDLFNKDNLKEQYYFFMILNWANYIGENKNEYEDLIHCKYTNLRELVKIEKFGSISNFIIQETKRIKNLFERDVEKFFLETTNSENQTAYLNKVIGFIVKDYEYLRNISLSKDNQCFSFIFFMLNNEYIKIFKHFINEYETAISEKNKSDLKNYLTKIRSKKSAFELNKNLTKDKKTEIISRLRENLISNGFIRDIATSDFRCFVDGEKIPKIKVDWLDSKTTLFTFYKLLNKNNIIKDSRNEHWKIICIHFSVRGNNIFPKDLVGLKETTNNIKFKKLKSFIEDLHVNTLT